jgi:hypothetical protein
LVELKSGGILKTEAASNCSCVCRANKTYWTPSLRKTAEQEKGSNPDAVKARVEIEIARYITSENNISAVCWRYQKALAEIAPSVRLLQEVRSESSRKK